MIEKFNFYDLYGNLLPGMAFLGLLWAPFGISQHFWPTAEISSAIAALSFAYILGHLLQSVAANVFPSDAEDTHGQRRYPSNFFLDPDDKKFSREFKKNLEEEVLKAFKLKLRTDEYGGGEIKEIDNSRRAAFFLCRGYLIREKIASYGEQFEGLYALMRGLSMSFWWGWALSAWQNRTFQQVSPQVAVVGLALATITTAILVCAGQEYKYRFWVDALTFLSLLAALFGVGLLLGKAHPLKADQIRVSALMGLACLFAGGRCFRGYKFYADQFAQAIWRDFVGHRLTPAPES